MMIQMKKMSKEKFFLRKPTTLTPIVIKVKPNMFISIHIIMNPHSRFMLNTEM